MIATVVNLQNEMPICYFCRRVIAICRLWAKVPLMNELYDADIRLGRLDVCSISDALDQLGLAPAVSGISSRAVRKRFGISNEL